MIVVDTSIFIDLFFEYDRKRTKLADALFKTIEEKEVPIFEPKVFKIELIGQLVRRTKKDRASIIAEDVFKDVNFIEDSEIYELTFLIAFETGCRTIDSFYITTAKVGNAIFVSNDKVQVESAKKFGVEAFHLIEEFEEIKKELGE